MKRLVFILLFILSALMANAQLFSSIRYNDKFDDILKAEQRKTLITKTDTTIVVEEKGKQPVTYYILNILEEGSMGSKDNIVNIVDNVYGYQTTWCVIKKDMLDKYVEAYKDFHLDSSDDNRNKLSSFWIFAVSRTVTSQYSGTFESEYFWLEDELNDDKLGKNVNRIIYIR